MSEPRAAKQHAPPPYVHAIAGFASGLVATAACYPLDLVKTRLQVQFRPDIPTGRPYYHGTVHAMRTIVATEGWRGLYQGLSPSMAGAAVAWGAYFYWYDLFKNMLRQPGQTHLSAWQHSAAAGLAGVAGLLVTNPFWVVKTRMALQLRGAPTLYRSVPHALWTIARKEGWRGLYRGLGPGLLGSTHGIVQFVAYEELKRRLSDDGARKLGPASVFIAGSLSKILAAVTLYPYQVVRSRLQDAAARHSRATDVIRALLREEGFAALYKGLVPTVLRVTPASALTLVVYEWMLGALPRFWMSSDET